MLLCVHTGMCRDGEVRLVGGDSEREGRVEMCYNGVWGAVCADGWNKIAADIVCSELGLGYSNSLSEFTQNIIMQESHIKIIHV